MSAETINGKALAKQVRAAAKKEIEALEVTPGFAAILVGNNPASELYVKLKSKACIEAGINFEKLLINPNTGQAYLLEIIDKLNARTDIHAILLQLPLPDGYDADEAIARIEPTKDVDGFHTENLRLYKEGQPRIIPGFPAGIMELVKSTGVPLSGKNGLVVANSPIFYEPLEIALKAAGLTPNFHQSSEPGLAEAVRQADVVIVAAGRPGLITKDMVKPGAVIIDAGTNRVDGKTIGDVAPEAWEVASHVTPVPGGVGPMTVAMVVQNCVKLTKQQI